MERSPTRKGNKGEIRWGVTRARIRSDDITLMGLPREVLLRHRMSIPHYRNGQRSATADPATFDLPLSEVMKTSVFRFPIRDSESRFLSDIAKPDLRRYRNITSI